MNVKFIVFYLNVVRPLLGPIYGLIRTVYGIFDVLCLRLFKYSFIYGSVEEQETALKQQR